MLIALGNETFLSTAMSDAIAHFEGGIFRRATEDECVQALCAVQPREIRNSPLSYQQLAVAVTLGTAYVGKISGFSGEKRRKSPATRKLD